jgi:hypothetical protein
MSNITTLPMTLRCPACGSWNLFLLYDDPVADHPDNEGIGLSFRLRLACNPCHDRTGPDGGFFWLCITDTSSRVQVTWRDAEAAQAEREFVTATFPGVDGKETGR